MKKPFFLFCSFFVSLFAYTQKQSSIWYFGTAVGLDFNQTPPATLRNGTANAQEGCATISDNSGKLLFYTNGLTVQNRTHTTMLNGNALRGDLSSTSNTIIVQAPESDSLYYLFTIGATSQVNKGFRYNIINMKGDGGFGEVIQKNIFVEEGYEKMAAVRHCNKKDIWIVIRKWESDEYYAYLLTASGLDVNPVISRTGLVVGGVQNNAIGTLKFSADGSKLVAVHSTETDLVELMNFDNATGIISNAFTIKPNVNPKSASFTGVYATEFSPNGRLLYVSANNSNTEPCILYQFDVSAYNAASIIASKQIITQVTPWYAGGLQTGPDGKIYFSMWKDTAISVINNPNVYGPGCNFVFNQISFGSTGEPLQFGLPTFIQSDLDSTLVPYNFSRSGLCTDRTVQYRINRTNGIDSVLWDFCDGTVSTALNPIHTYLASGFYCIKLTVYTTGCSGAVATTIQKTTWVADTTPLLGNDILACSFENLQLNVNIAADVNYKWSTGSAANNIAVTRPGSYWVQLEQNGCIIADTININVKPKPQIYIGNDTTVCASTGIELIAKTTSAVTYLWNTGETTQSIKIFKPGVYSIEVTENNCKAYDTVNVVWGDCPFYVPNAFSPNGDGVNDRFGILNGITVSNFSLRVYNRYGQVVFNTANSSDKWDGTFKSKPLPNGGYTWQIVYVNGLGYTKWLKGTVILLR